mmetsp:Transcript_30086/g.77614  ORF Transcript_30086/g.77614 Transcript_30086/m.77614 type:complete len:80 (+) Transcript_30086:81-320(+)
MQPGMVTAHNIQTSMEASASHYQQARLEMDKSKEKKLFRLFHSSFSLHNIHAFVPLSSACELDTFCTANLAMMQSRKSI